MLADIMKIALGDCYSMILMRDGSVWSTPIISRDGFAASHGFSGHFTRVVSGGVTAMATGTGYSIVLKQDGSVWATGSNAFGQLGCGSKTYNSKFVQVILGGVRTVAAGGWPP